MNDVDMGATKRDLQDAVRMLVEFNFAVGTYISGGLAQAMGSPTKSAAELADLEERIKGLIDKLNDRFDLDAGGDVR